MAWWLVTLTMTVVFGSLGALFGGWACDLVLSGEVPIPGTNLFGYLLVSIPALASVPCFGTVLLRLAGKPSAWLGCASIGLAVVTVVFGGMIAMTVALVAGSSYGPLALGVLVLFAAVMLALQTVERWAPRLSSDR
jgi:hypothetical protein